MLVKAVETLPEGARPLVRSDRGYHCRWPGWLDLMDVLLQFFLSNFCTVFPQHRLLVSSGNCTI